MQKNKTGIIALAVTFVVISAGVALAQDGHGPNKAVDGRQLQAPGYSNHREMVAYDTDRWGHPSRQQAAKHESLQRHFMHATRELRRDIDAKRVALQCELNKPHPNGRKTMILQKQLIHLQRDLDQKELAHRVAVRKIMVADDAWRGADSGNRR